MGLPGKAFPLKTRGTQTDGTAFDFGEAGDGDGPGGEKAESTGSNSSPRGRRLCVHCAGPFPRKKGGGRTGFFPSRLDFWVFSQLSLLTEGCAKLFLQFGGQIHQSALYQWEGCTTWCCYPDLRTACRCPVFAEYTSLIYDGPVFLSFLAEHGKPLIARDALKILASL